jgi:hypothetical protein
MNWSRDKVMICVFAALCSAIVILVAALGL